MFCTQCGAKMVETKVPAENYEFYDMFGPAGHHDPFNKETGERQFVRRFRCPNSTRWFNKHDDFMNPEIV